MKYKTLFRLSLKVIGVYLCAQAIPSIVIHTFDVLSAYSMKSPEGTGYGYMGDHDMWIYLSNILYPVISIAFGLYLFFGGEWIVNKAIPSNRPYCHQCGYDLSGAVTNRCPECDTPFNLEDVKASRLTDE